MITEIVFHGFVPGLNNSGKRKGLMSMSIREKKVYANRFQYEARAATRNRHTGPVRFELTRHSIGPPMDADNLASTKKLLSDAIVRAGILPDDNPKIIKEYTFDQTKAINRKSQFTVVRIIDIQADEQIGEAEVGPTGGG